MPPPSLAFEVKYSVLGRGPLYRTLSDVLALYPYLAPRSAKYTSRFDLLRKRKNSDESGLDVRVFVCYTRGMDEQATHTDIGRITIMEPSPADIILAELPDTYIPPSLSRDEETFALAIIETAGNVSAAYKMAFGEDASFPLARGKELLTNPGVILKIKQITDAVQDASLISVGAHLDQLARIRDLAVNTQQLKVAFAAERSRGEAVGIYQRHDKGKGPGNAVQVNITMASKHDENI